MSSNSPASEMLNTRYSTPAPELDDHRHPARPVPRIEAGSPGEVISPTARRGTLDRSGLLHVNEALRDPHGSASVSRDFEQAIADDDGSDKGHGGEDRRGSARARRPTNRQGRQEARDRLPKSRDSSSSASTSPPNSVEAFADPRRRERANTLESRPASIIEALAHRRPSNVTAPRRASVSNVSRVKPATHRGEDEASDEDNVFPTYEEPGKTFKIDFEELDEFVALSAKGLVPGQAAPPPKPIMSTPVNPPRLFHDLRDKMHRADVPKIVMNCENLHEQPLDHLSYEFTRKHHKDDFDEKASIKTLVPKKERFTLFSTDTQGHGVTFGTELGDFVSDGTTTFRDLFDLGPDGGVWWLDVLNPTSAELECFRKAFKLHPLTKEDIEQQEAREKVELFQQYYFVCFRSFHADHSSDEFLDPVNVYIIVCAEGVLSFSFSETPHARNVRKRISKTADFVNLGPDYICYALIDDIVDSFAPVIHHAETESENLEDQVFIARDDDYTFLLRQIGQSRKNVLSMMRLLGGKADVVKGFSKRCNEQYSVAPRGDIGVYLGDIQDHVVTMMSTLGHIEKMLSRSHANYLAQLNVDSIIRGNHTNKVLSKITVLATILVPLNLITGLFGMNVPVPGKSTTSLAWFFGIVGVIVCVILTGVMLARRCRVI